MEQDPTKKQAELPQPFLFLRSLKMNMDDWLESAVFEGAEFDAIQKDNREFERFVVMGAQMAAWTLASIEVVTLYPQEKEKLQMSKVRLEEDLEKNFLIVAAMNTILGQDAPFDSQDLAVKICLSQLAGINNETVRIGAKDGMDMVLNSYFEQQGEDMSRPRILRMLDVSILPPLVTPK